MKRTTVLVLIVLLTSFPSWAGDVGHAAAGAALFKAKCSPCHGLDGTGAKDHKLVGADLHSAEVQQLSDDDLYAAIATSAHHKQYPHAWVTRGALTPAQARDLVAYIRELGGKK